MNKAFYIYLSELRKAPHRPVELRRMKLDELQTLFSDVRDEELLKYQKHVETIKSHELMKLKVDDLQKMMKERSLPYSGLSKLELVETIISTPVETPMILDESQERFVNAKEQRILLNAGPGAGKTTTLCEYALRRSNLRILFLVYTKAAEQSIREKMKNKIIKTVQPMKPGIHVFTMNSYVSKRGIKGTGYDDEFEKNVNLGRQDWEVWDIVIVDEIQDILPKHEKFINQMMEDSIIFAGDLRQSIYQGASFMKKVWNDESFTRYDLKYNHRSGPKIVELLNTFSRHHFGKYHVDQIAVKDHECTIKGHIIKDDPVGVGHTAASLLTKDPSYIISPVSVRKFNSSTPVNAARSKACELGHFTVVMEDEGKLNSTYNTVGNVYSVKGTERSNVIIIQADVPYSKYCIDKESLAFIIYVALSRARDSLHIILSDEVKQDSILRCIAGLMDVQVAEKMENSPPEAEPHIIVTDEFRRFDPRHDYTSEKEDLAPLDLRSLEAPDFVGYLVEETIAKMLDVPSPSKVEFVDDHSNSKRMFIEGDTLVCHYPRRMEKMVEHLKTLKISSTFDLLKLKFSFESECVWTLNDDLENVDITPSLQPYVRRIREICGDSFKHSVCHHRMLNLHRSDRSYGSVCGVTDIETDEYVIEIKHANDLRIYDDQLSTYAALSGKKPIMVNTKVGFIKHTYSTSYYPGRVDLVSKALALLKCAQQKRIQHLQIEPNIKETTFIALDVETYNGTITEVGAIAFTSTGDLIDVFHQLNALPSPGCSMIEQMCGLTVNTFDHSAIKASFSTWLKSFNEFAIFQFGGNDCKTLNIDHHHIDVRNLYKTWLHRSERQYPSSLSDAMHLLCGHISDEDDHGCTMIFKEHRAFEDALALMMIIRIIIA